MYIYMEFWQCIDLEILILRTNLSNLNISPSLLSTDGLAKANVKFYSVSPHMRLEPKDGYCWFPYSLTLSFNILHKSVAQGLAHGHFSVDTKVWVGSFQNVLETYMLANKKNKVEVTDLFLNLWVDRCAWHNVFTWLITCWWLSIKIEVRFVFDLDTTEPPNPLVYRLRFWCICSIWSVWHGTEKSVCVASRSYESLWWAVGWTLLFFFLKFDWEVNCAIRQKLGGRGKNEVGWKEYI